MKILIVSGFLGAGKTTFMQHLLNHIDDKVAIMENEYGALSVDANRLADRGEIFDFSEGCICCSMKSDFTMSVLSIANSIDVDCLLIEPTGVGLLGNILENLEKIQYEKIKILAPITVIDAKNFFSELEKYPDLMRNQVRYAQKLILSKIEDMDENDLNLLVNKLKEINPKALIFSKHYSQQNEQWWKNFLADDYQFSGKFEKVEPPSLTTISFKNLSFSDEAEFHGLCRMLLRGTLGRIQRAKGEVKISNQIYQFDLIEKELHIEKSDALINNGVILIGEELNLNDLSLLFSFYQN